MGNPISIDEVAERKALAHHRQYDLRHWTNPPKSTDPRIAGQRRRIAIVCSGPSAVVTWPSAAEANGYHQVIAINRAIMLIKRLAIWCIGDHQVFKQVSPAIRHCVFTPARTAHNLTRNNTGETVSTYGGALPILPWETAGYRDNSGKQGVGFSLIAALHLARHQWAVEIDLFGADWTGTTDFDGETPEDYWRTDSRWSLERTLVTQLMQRFERQRITCRRIIA